MRKIFMLVGFTITGAGVSAQVTERVIVKAGDEIGPAISPNGHFRFAEFTDGVVTLKYGGKSKTRFNYHICNGEMQFIDANGDTLAIWNASHIDNISIGDNTKFVYVDKFYHEVIAESPAMKLGKRIRVNIENDRKTQHGKSDPTGQQMQLNNFMFGQSTVVLAYDVEVRKTTTYFWIDSKYNAMPANKRNSLKLVEFNKQPKLQAFIDENKTDFNNEEDLRKLLAFAATISS